MANYEAATISTDNKEVLESLDRHFQEENNNFGYIGVQGTAISLRNRHGKTLEDLKKLSKEHANVPISLTLAFESQRYAIEYHLSVLNGDYSVVS